MISFKSILIAAALAGAMSGSVFAQATNDAPATGKQDARIQNRATAKTVRKALTATKGLHSDNIVVFVKGNVITLAGSVPDGSQIQMATDAAQAAAGSLTVSNKLSIKQPGGN